MITYKYNIYKSKNTKYIDSMLRECCFVWNHALSLQKRYYKLFGKYISYNRMSSHFTKRIKRNMLHSQTCKCGYVNKSLSLKERTWACPVCGVMNDRDLLASQNILRKGISELESQGKSLKELGVLDVCI